MELEDKINSIPLFRTLGLPSALRNVCLIAFNEDLGKLEKLCKNFPLLNPCRIFIPDISGEIPVSMLIKFADRSARLTPLHEFGKYPELEKILVLPSNPVLSSVYLSKLAILGAQYGVKNFYLYGDMPPAHSMREPLPDFFRDKRDLLRQAMKLFTDNDSRETFAGRIKAIITGNAGFMPIATHGEYFHPLVRPEEGDVLIDGGVSDMVQSQKDFLAAVGSKGRIFGFEPIPSMARKAQKELMAFPNYHLQCLGLGEKQGKVVFRDLRDSSHMLPQNSATGTDCVECELTSIDAFCHRNHLQRVDCIKLDIEGAELAALRGARNTIRTMAPKLIICLYHKPQDLYEIPLYLERIAPFYKLYLAHSNAGFTDTILYGLPMRTKN